MKIVEHRCFDMRKVKKLIFKQTWVQNGYIKTMNRLEALLCSWHVTPIKLYKAAMAIADATTIHTPTVEDVMNELVKCSTITYTVEEEKK